MRKVIKIEVLDNFIIRCQFDNGMIRDLDIKIFIDKNGKYGNKLLQKSIFRKVNIGDFGQLLWEGIAEIKELDGQTVSSEYDIDSDFAYINSVLVSKASSLG